MLADPANLNMAQLTNNARELGAIKQNLAELVDIVQPPEKILDRMAKNPRTTWSKKRQQLIASLSQRA